MRYLPKSTEWTLEAEDTESISIFESIYRIHCLDRLPNGTRIIGRPSTGFLLTSGDVITARHVVQGYAPSDIIALSIYNEKITFENIVTDEPGGYDAAILKPDKRMDGGLALCNDEKLRVGEQIATLGFPYLGDHADVRNARTMPLLSIGYLAGYDDYSEDSKTIKYYIINGGVTIGNSGSPIFKFKDEKVAGMVVRKFAPFTSDIAPELAAHEPELIAGIFNAYNIVSPSMMYRAICASELKKLCQSKSIPF